MSTYVFEGVMTALTSISHIGETHGIRSKLRREKVVQPDGSVEEVPVISGNSIRGILRDRGMLHMVDALGYGVNRETGEVRGLTLPAFHFLFSGGALNSTGVQGLDIDLARQMRETIPLISLFGGAVGNQIMPGKAKIGKAIPVCAETAHLLPKHFVNGAGAVSIWDLCQEEAYTRRDDEKNEHLRQLIAPEARALLEASAAAKREKRGTTEDVREEGEQHQQMRYYVETLAAGTRLYWDVTLEGVTDLEFEAFCVALAEFSRFPYLGGKSGVGHGKVAIRFDKWVDIDPRTRATGTEVGFALGQLYAQHLEARRADIRAMLDAMQ